MYNNSLNLGNSFKFSKYQYCICKTVTIFVWMDCLGKTKTNKKIKWKQMCKRHLEYSTVIGSQHSKKLLISFTWPNLSLSFYLYSSLAGRRNHSLNSEFKHWKVSYVSECDLFVFILFCFCLPKSFSLFKPPARFFSSKPACHLLSFLLFGYNSEFQLQHLFPYSWTLY